MRQQKVDVESPRFVEHPDGGIEGGSFAGIGSSLPAVAQVKKQLGGAGRLSHAFSPCVQLAQLPSARPRLAGGCPCPESLPANTLTSLGTSWTNSSGARLVNGCRTSRRTPPP